METPQAQQPVDETSLETLPPVMKYNPVIHHGIQLLALSILLYWSYCIIEPFITLLIWGSVMAIALYPTHKNLSKKLGNREFWSAGIIVFVMITLLLIPSVWLLLSTVDEVSHLAEIYKTGQFAIMAPSETIKEWPLIGKKLFEIWTKASINLNDLIVEYADIVKEVSIFVFELLANTGKAVVLFLLSIIVSGLFLAFSKPSIEFSKSIFKKLAGQSGESYTDVAASTVRSVTKGVLGVAIIQSLLAGIGLVVAGIPFAGLWIVLCIILTIVQVGVFPVSIGVMIYIWSYGDTVTAVLLTIWMLIVGVSDNILKPFLLGKSAVPMPIVFIGSIGGFIFSGFIGLFTGAIALSLTYKLLTAWLKTPNA